MQAFFTVQIENVPYFYSRSMCCCSALKIHISEECYGKLAYCGKHVHGYVLTLRGEMDIQVVLLKTCELYGVLCVL